jgi:hypothetical protein
MSDPRLALEAELDSRPILPLLSGPEDVAGAVARAINRNRRLVAGEPLGEGGAIELALRDRRRIQRRFGPRDMVIDAGSGKPSS